MQADKSAHILGRQNIKDELRDNEAVRETHKETEGRTGGQRESADRRLTIISSADSEPANQSASDMSSSCNPLT